MDITYQYPPELFNLLVDTIPRLMRSKKDVVLFFRGAGVERKDLADIEAALQSGGNDLNKFGMTRTVLQRLSERGEAGLRERREVVKRIVEFEDFSTCWDNDQLKAKGLVAEIRRVVNVKDSFVRMQDEKDAESNRHRAEYEKKVKEQADLRERRQGIKNDLAGLFTVADPHKRGILLESVLNRLFAIEGVSVREAFVIRNSEDGSPLEQIDGVIALDGALYLVEMKWWNKPIGVSEVNQHISRIFLRGDVRGIYISASGYTSSAVDTCRQALTQKTIALTTLEEFVLLLEGDGDLRKFIKAKVEAAMIERNPFLSGC
jgi:hypothetical protein